MSWVHSMWIAGALAALARGHHAMIEGHDLSKSGYHLCTANETRTVSCVVFRVAPYIVQRHCGGWLPWRMCNVTLYKITYGTEYKKVTQEVTRCCHGFIRVGSYCALSLDRSREFTTKPGLCPAAGEEPPDTCETCVWDIDCSGWQKCCETVNGSRCVDPATFSHYVANGGSSLNVTVTVKTDYHRMMASDKGLLNHTQLLLAMVNGALNSSEVSVKYLSSCPVGPYRTATSLIIGCNTTLSLDDTTADMHLLLRDVTEVSSVTVEDVDECAHPALRNCSPQAECNNTVASYRCTCRQGYTDVLPQNAGASCEADQTTTVAPPCIYGPAGPPSPPAPPTQDGPVENHTPVVVSSPDPSQPTAAPALSTTSENLSPSYTTYTSVTPPEESSTCAPPQLTQLSSSHITDTSFYLYWSSPSPSNQTSYLVVLRYGSEVISLWETNENTLNVTGLYPGVLYNVTVTPCACDAQGESLRVNVKTAAQTLAATARVTNINFTEDFLNSSSQAYLNFSTSFKEEIYKSLSPELMELVKSGKVRIEITSVSWGSVVVNFTIVSAQNYDTPSVSDAVLSSLLNSSNYYLDENSTRVFDFDECASGINDCSQYATCNNTWGSYTCVCNDGFEDMDPGWPGRVCGAPLETTTAPIQPLAPSTPASTSLTMPQTTRDTTMQAPDTSDVTAADSANTTTATASFAATTDEPTTTHYIAPPTTVDTATHYIAPPTTVDTATHYIAPPTTVDTATTSLTTPTAVTTATTSLTTPTTVTTATTSLTTPTTVTTATTSLTTPTAVPTTTTSLTTPTAVTTATTSLTTPTTVTTATTSLTTPTAVPTATTSLTTPTTVDTTSLTTPTTVTTATTSLTTPTTVTTATTSLTTPTAVTTATTSLTTPTTVDTTSLTTPTTVPTATTSLTTPTAVPTATTSLTTPTTVDTTSLTTPTTVPTATTSLTTPTTVPTATTSLTTPTTVDTATTSMTTPTTVDTATTSLTTPTAGVIVNLPTDMTNGKISVECGLTAIMVTVAKEFLLTNQISELSLHLGRESNRADVLNSTHVRLAVPWNDTDLLSNNTYYTAQVTLFNSVAPQANRTPGVARILKLPIICTYRKSILTSQHFGDIGYNMIIDPITVSGSFKVIMQLLNGTFPLPQNYTLSPDEDVVVRVTLNTSAEEVKLVISRCWATPTLNPVDIHSYIFLNSSCPLPHSYTSIISNGNASSSSLSVRIFSFVMLDVIYLHCQVQICVEMGSATCVPDCSVRKARLSNTLHRAVGSSGALFRLNGESLEEPLDMVHVVGFSVLGITMSLVFLGGLMCLFFYQRNRIGNYNFNIKPRQDNFTFHVFNT